MESIKRRLLYLLVVGFIVFLIGCQNTSEPTEVTEDTGNEEALLMKERALSNQEAEGLLTHMLKDIQEEMSDLQKTHEQWFEEQAIKDSDLDDPNFQEAIRITNEKISDHVIADEENIITPLFVYAYFCSCDSIDSITLGQTGERLTSEIIDSETMHVRYFQFAEYHGLSPGPGFTTELEFEWEDNAWKWSNIDYISVEDELIHATKEEVESAFGHEAENITEYEEGDEVYFKVFYAGDNYIEIRSSDASIDGAHME